MNMKRMRGRNNRSGPGGGGGGGPIRHQSGNVPMNRNHVFDSIGPDLRVRGTSQQLFEKYLQLGRDATSSGDRVMAESYFQYAEHYFRILNAMNQAVAQQGAQQGYGQQQRRAEQSPEQMSQEQMSREQPGGEEGEEGDLDGGDQDRDDRDRDRDEQPSVGSRPIAISAGQPE